MIPAPTPSVEFRPTRRLDRSPHRDRLLAAAREVAEAFPELVGVVRLDLLSSASRYRGLTFPQEEPPRVALRPHTRTPVALRATLAHELTHLLQTPRGPVPQGERACDLHALARTGERYPHPPAYLRLPRGAAREWPRWAGVAAEMARESLARRDAGERTYLQGWERRFRERTRTPPVPPGGAGREA